MDQERVCGESPPNTEEEQPSARRHGSWVLALAAAAWLCPERASADIAGTDLRSLLGRSEMVAIGKVTAVTSSSGPGLSKATILIEENLKGSAPGSIEIGFDRNPTESVGFATGSRVVLFLRRTGTPATIALASSVHGALEVPPARLDPARAVLRTVILAGSGLRLSTVRANLLRASGQPPRPLVGSLLRSLTSTLNSSDASLLTEMACDARNEYLPAAQLWAMRQAGVQRLAAARSCLEATVAGTDLTRRLAASEALGNLRDPRSLPILGSALDSVMGGSTDGSGRPADGGLAVSLVLAMGKLRDPAAVQRLLTVASGEEDLALHSTVVHALGLIGGTETAAALTVIGNGHPNALVRELARQALVRLGQGRTS